MLPTMCENMIGVKVVDLAINVDDRGILSEIFRTDWTEVDATLPRNSKIHQVYLVENTTNAVRAFHKHKHLIDFFIIVKGSAKFNLVDDRKDSHSYQCIKTINVTDKKLQMLIVPTGVYHGWKADKGTILISVANELYKGINHIGKLDEERIPWDVYGKEIWETKFK